MNIFGDKHKKIALRRQACVDFILKEQNLKRNLNELARDQLVALEAFQSTGMTSPEIDELNAMLDRIAEINMEEVERNNAAFIEHIHSISDADFYMVWRSEIRTEFRQRLEAISELAGTVRNILRAQNQELQRTNSIFANDLHIRQTLSDIRRDIDDLPSTEEAIARNVDNKALIKSSEGYSAATERSTPQYRAFIDQWSELEALYSAADGKQPRKR